MCAIIAYSNNEILRLGSSWFKYEYITRNTHVIEIYRVPHFKYFTSSISYVTSLFFISSLTQVIIIIIHITVSK